MKTLMILTRAFCITIIVCLTVTGTRGDDCTPQGTQSQNDDTSGVHFPMHTCLATSPPLDSVIRLPRTELGSTSSTPGANILPTVFKSTAGYLSFTVPICNVASDDRRAV